MNDVLEEHGIRSIHVRELELEWDTIGSLDVISFHVEVVFGNAKGGLHK